MPDPAAPSEAELRAALAALPPRRGAAEVAEEQRLASALDAELLRRWPVRHGRSPALGRFLLAARRVAPGETVVCEPPAASWPVEGPLPEALHRSCERHGVSAQGCVRALAALPGMGLHARQTMAQLSEPEFDPCCAGMVALCNVARDAAQQLEELAGEDETDLARLILAVKCNCHKHCANDPQSGAALGGVCRLGSRLAHSCRPSLCCYLPADARGLRFVALRDISEGETLGFSYRGDGLWLSQSARRRQADLRRCFYFDCMCERCAGADLPRQVPCSAPGCGGLTCPAGGAWRCGSCGSSAAPPQAVLAAERAAEEAVDALDCGQQVCLAGRWSPLGAALRAAAPQLGAVHCAVGALLHMAQEYFSALASGPPPPPVAAALRCGAEWPPPQLSLLQELAARCGALHLLALLRGGVRRDCPLVFGHAAAELLQGLPPDSLPGPQSAGGLVPLLRGEAEAALRPVYQGDPDALAAAGLGADGGRSLQPADECALGSALQRAAGGAGIEVLAIEWERSPTARALRAAGLL